MIALRRGKRERTRDGRMPLRAHLAELRNRVLIAAAAILVGAIVGFLLSDLVIEAGAAPLHRVTAVDSSLNFTTIGGAFDLRIRVALTVGVVLASPVWLYQLWAYLVPGLTARERRIGMAVVFTAVPLFFVGAAFGWWVMPNIVILLAGFAPEGAASFLSASEYFDFLLRLVLAVGASFVTPVVLVGLNAAGMLRAKTLLRAWRGAIVAIVVFAATVTPASDLMSMFLIAVPLVVLYFGAWGWCALHDRRVDGTAATTTAVASAA